MADIYKLSKTYRFEAGHQLDSAKAKECEKPHGHSYKVIVHVTANKLDSNGMVMDFKELDAVVEPVIEFFDHSMINSELMGFNPTAELLSKWIYDQIEKKINKTYDLGYYRDVLAVELWETDKCCCTFTK